MFNLLICFIFQNFIARLFVYNNNSCINKPCGSIFLIPHILWSFCARWDLNAIQSFHNVFMDKHLRFERLDKLAQLRNIKSVKSSCSKESEWIGAGGTLTGLSYISESE
ncbi:hypothetical protein DERP_013262 [Dermatophagoides pteronyssinus]|uniref:Uncharacterized protein n=1 Tax=Dermatophagoides pteronyssinus TaxID=6956 RepID=A0ABQ8IRT9_DERPT|nr:hypothetical protein DERP_013262 [Dermatophagoides pteronyssinus]